MHRIQKVTPLFPSPNCRIIIGAVISTISIFFVINYLNLRETGTDFPKRIKRADDEEPNPIFRRRLSRLCNYVDLEWRKPMLLDNVTEALADPDIHITGIYGSDDEIKDCVLKKVYNRIGRDNLFDPVLSATVTKKANVRKIQDELANQLGLTFRRGSKTSKRANELNDWIKNKHKILIVLRHLHKGLELDKVGILYGANHTGCKILFTSTTKYILSSNMMHAQKNFMVD